MAADPKAVWGVRGSATVTLSDSADIEPTRGLLCDSPTSAVITLKVTYVDGLTDTISLASNLWHPMQVKRVWSTGSTSGAVVHAGY